MRPWYRMSDSDHDEHLSASGMTTRLLPPCSNPSEVPTQGEILEDVGVGGAAGTKEGAGWNRRLEASHNLPSTSHDLSPPPSHNLLARRGRHLTAHDEASRPFYLKTFWKLTLVIGGEVASPPGLARGPGL